MRIIRNGSAVYKITVVRFLIARVYAHAPANPAISVFTPHVDASDDDDDGTNRSPL